MDTYSSLITSTLNTTFREVDELKEVGLVGDAIPLPIQLEYCGASLKSIGDTYRSIHGYASLVVCLFGFVANILNLIVLTKREMISPTNAILTGMALADLLNMVEYVPYAIYMTYYKHEKTYGWAMLVLMHSNFSQVCHTISIWLNVTLAVWRYIIVALPLKSKTVCTMQRAKYAIALCYIVVPIICIPNYLSYAVREISGKNTTSGSASGEKKYVVNLSHRAINHPFLMTTNFWLYSVVMKLIPCAILTIVSLRLIHSLMQVKKRQNLIFANRSSASEDFSGISGSGRKSSRSSHDMVAGSDRSTKMLLAVLVLFLFTEFTQGILGLLSGPLGDPFFVSCYMPLANLMDFFALLNSAINFIVYCVMSRKFRETFSKLFWVKKIMKLRILSGKVSQPIPI